MIRDPDLIYYACIAKGTTVLAEFNSKSAAALGAIAARCLEKTPPFHATFTHTVRSRTYTFLIDEPLVYFAISDDKLEKSEVLAFLKSVRDSFLEVFKGGRKLENLSSHCYQSEFNPVFCQLLGPGRALQHIEGIRSPTGHRVGHSRILQYGSGPIRERVKPNGEHGLNKMKNRLFLEEQKIGPRNGAKENDENGGNGVELSREIPIRMRKNGGLCSAESTGRQKAKKVWKKQAWIVLSFDLIICAILFGVWLCVCSGLNCINK